MSDSGLIAAVGMFDGVHLGHRTLISHLCTLGLDMKLHPAAVTFANHPLECIAPERAPLLLNTLQDRHERLIQAGLSEVVVLNFTPQLQKLTAAEFLTNLKRDYRVEALVVGYNHHLGHDRVTGREAFTKLGRDIGLHILPAPEFTLPGGERVSSSVIRGHLHGGDVENANRGLGYRYTLKGKVVAGKQLGRTIGFPTANIQTESPNLLVPAEGVYAVNVRMPSGIVRRGILNIGRRPTVDNDNAIPTVEVHILDFSGDLYGQPLAIEFLKRLRSEQRFPSLEALRKQLTIDAQQARSLTKSNAL